MLSTLALIVICGLGAVVCFIAGGVTALDKSDAARRKARTLAVAGGACVIVGVLSPWIAQTFRLP